MRVCNSHLLTEISALCIMCPSGRLLFGQHTQAVPEVECPFQRIPTSDSKRLCMAHVDFTVGHMFLANIACVYEGQEDTRLCAMPMPASLMCS